MPHVSLAQFRFFFVLFLLFVTYFKANCNINLLWLFRFYSMVGICKITQWQHSSTKIHVVLIKTTSQITLQVAILIINYLVAAF